MPATARDLGIAHELGHIRNRDMLLQTFSATLAGAASCLLVSLRGFARLLTGARGMPTEAETLHLIAGSKPPPVFTDPHTGRQMAHTVAWSAC